MYKNKLISLLSSFSRKEMTRYREFAWSPYHNKHEDVRSLVQLLEGLFPHFNAQNCDRMALFAQLYPAKRHDQKQLALLFSYTMRLAEKLLLQQAHEAATNRHPILLLQTLRTKAQNKHYLKVLKSAEASLEQWPGRDKDFYKQRFWMASEADNYYKQQAKSFQRDDSIQQKQIYLDLYYISEKLTDACEMLLRSTILEIKYQTGLLDAVRKEVEQNLSYYRSIPAIIVYYDIYSMLTHRDRQHYVQALRTVQQQESYFAKSEVYKIYNYLQSYCVAQINQNRTFFLRELFDLNNLMLDRELLFDNGYLSEWRYKNMITVALRLRELEWVKLFLETYKKYLHPEVVQNAYGFNLASYHYFKGEYEKVLPLLLQVEYTDLRYSLGAKSLLLRTYYDLNEYEAFLSLSKSFKRYVQRHKDIEESRRRGFYNLLRLTKRSFQIRSEMGYVKKEKSYSDAKKLHREVVEEANIINKSWLNKKIEALVYSASGKS